MKMIKLHAILETIENNPQQQQLAPSDTGPCKDGKEYIRVVHYENACFPHTHAGR